MYLKTLSIFAAVLLYPVELNATPQSGSTRVFEDGGRESTGRTTFVSSGGSEKRSTTSETTTSSSSTSTTQVGGTTCGTSNDKITIGGDNLICDCGDCIQHLYDLSKDDLNFADITMTTTTYTEVQSNCGIQLTKLSNDNAQLTKDKNSAMRDLDSCRDRYTFISTDLVASTTELNNVKKRLQSTLDDNTKLNTQLITVTADAQKWKSKSESGEVDLKISLDNNLLLTNSAKECSTTILNLRATVNEANNKNNKCLNDSNDLKRKWEAETTKTTAYEKRIKELQAANDDLTSKITKLTNDLNSSRNINKQNDIDINKLKDTNADLTKQMSKCTVDLGSCNGVLKQVTDKFNFEKTQGVEAEQLRIKVQLQLGECNSRTKDIELNLDTERKAGNKCKADITTIQNDFTKRNQKYEDDIADLKLNNKNSIDKYEAALKLEKDNSANSRNDVINLKNQINDLGLKLSVSIKNADDWQKRSGFCDDDSVNLKLKIETLQKNVADVNLQLSTSISNGNGLQSDLSGCKSKWDICTDDLVKTRQNLAGSELVNSNLKNTIDSLETAKNSCQTDLKKLQSTLDDNAKLNTQLIAITAESQKCKGQLDNLNIDMKRVSDSNGALSNTLSQYSTTISNLRATVNEVNLKNNKCLNDLNEWKLKWDDENAKVVTNEKSIKDLVATNDDLTSRITKSNTDLTSCRNVNQQNDIDINKLKDTNTDLTKQLSKSTVDLGSCNGVLKQVTDDFNFEKTQGVEAEQLRIKVQLQLGECLSRTKDIEQNLDTERKAVDKCKADVTTIQNDSSKRNQKYEDDIADLKSNSKSLIDQCDAALKLEKDSSASGRNDIITLKNQITGLETKLSISIKNADDWQKRSGFCEDDSVKLKQKIETLQKNVADVNLQLSTCITNGNGLHNDLTACTSRRDSCTDELERTKKKLVDTDLIIVNLNNSVGSLEIAKNSCLVDVSKLRCDVDQYLKSSKTAQDKANEAVLQALSIFDANKKLLGNFVDSHDTTCKI